MENTDRTTRRKTVLIMATMSLFMFSPILMHLLGFRIPIFENLGLSIGPFAPWYAWVIALLVSIAFVIYTFKAIPFVLKMQREVSIFKLVGLLAIVGGILEEVVFRRWLMDLLLSWDLGFVLQILISGFAFGLGHIMWGIFGKDKGFSKGAFFSTSILGFLLAAVYLIGNRNIGPCIISHSLINIIIEPWLMLAAISKKR